MTTGFFDNPPAVSETAPDDSAPKKSNRGRKPGTQPKVRLGIPEEFFKFNELDEQETAEARRKREPRTEQQRWVDEIVLKLWRRYIELGEPKNWADKPVYSWEVPKEHEETALFYITKACMLYGRKQVLGERIYFKNDSKKEMVRIAFSVERRRDRTPKPTTD